MRNPKIGRPVRLVLLGDGDSDSFLTKTTLKRARYGREGLSIMTPIADEGMDYNGILTAVVDRGG